MAYIGAPAMRRQLEGKVRNPGAIIGIRSREKYGKRETAARAAYSRTHGRAALMRKLGSNPEKARLAKRRRALQAVR
ncbi:MAG: hypothetical protein DRP01_06675 [Archaeoglobales archaeon]|nr:MAG: hypothetical protein DRP01_06675 [Archaeoglobales archaeon]